MSRFLLLAIAAILAGCASKQVCEPIRVPVPVEVPRNAIEPIPAELLREHPVETGPLARCPQIAQMRGDELRRCNRDKALIRERGQ